MDAVAAFAVAYLLGSIPFGLILTRLAGAPDLRSIGSGNIGATNVIRSGAKKLGVLTFLLDVCKGIVAVLVVSRIALAPIPHQDAEALAALCAILGHIYTVWLRFKGGKGVATALGVFLALSPYAALAGLAVFAFVFALSKYVSLSSILAALAFVPLALLLPHPAYTPLMIAVIFAVPLIVIARHHQNIARLLNGTEYRLGKPRTTHA